MLCTLAIHLTREGSYMLRISGSTALGSSGTGGRDSKHYATSDELFRDLDGLGLGSDVATAAARELVNPEARKQFIKFAEDVQVPFEVLEQADIYLFDLD